MEKYPNVMTRKVHGTVNWLIEIKLQLNFDKNKQKKDAPEASSNVKRFK